MVWVKGELLTEIDAAALDPSGALGRNVCPYPFDRREWFRAVLADRGGLPLIARVTSEGAIAWLFLHRDGSRHVASLSSWYSFAWRPVFAGQADAARRRAMLVAAARRLRKARPPIASIRFDVVPAGDGSAALVESAFAQAGWRVFTDEASASWTADVAGLDFERYWAARPGQLRSTLKRKASKADFQATIHSDFDEESWAAYESVYQQSWKPEEGSPAFLRALAEREAAAGGLRLGIGRIDGAPVAAQLWVVDSGTAYIHKLAYLPDAAEHSPGTLLSAAMFQHVIDEDRVEVIDFGTGDDSYKADWMDTRSPLMRIRAYNPAHPAGLIGAVRAWAARLVRPRAAS